MYGWDNPIEVHSVTRTDQEPGIYSGIHGIVFCDSTLVKARKMATDYATDQRKAWADMAYSVRQLRIRNIES